MLSPAEDRLGMRPANLTQAFYQGAWLPCQIREEDLDTGKLEVRVVDRTGVHDVWVVAQHVRGRTTRVVQPKPDTADS